MPPGSAACSSRFARLTASPVTNVSPVDGIARDDLAGVDPDPAGELDAPPPRAAPRSAPRAAAASRAPARTARSASSSWTTGRRRRPSPRRRGTARPCRRARGRPPPSSPRSAPSPAGSSRGRLPRRAPSSPTVSQKRIVTVLRTSSPVMAAPGERRAAGGAEARVRVVLLAATVTNEPRPECRTAEAAQSARGARRTLRSRVRHARQPPPGRHGRPRTALPPRRGDRHARNARDPPRAARGRRRLRGREAVRRRGPRARARPGRAEGSRARASRS